MSAKCHKKLIGVTPIHNGGEGALPTWVKAGLRYLRLAAKGNLVVE